MFRRWRLAAGALLLLGGCQLTVEPLDESVPRFLTGTGRERQYRSYPNAAAAVQAALGAQAVVAQRWRIQNDAEFTAATGTGRPAALELLCRIGMDGRWFIAAARPVPDDTSAVRIPAQFPEIDRLGLQPAAWNGAGTPQPLPDDERWRLAADLVARWCAALPRGDAAPLVSPDGYRTTYYRFFSPAARRTLAGATPGGAWGVSADGELQFAATVRRTWAGTASVQPLLLLVVFDGERPVIGAIHCGPVQGVRA